MLMTLLSHPKIQYTRYEKHIYNGEIENMNITNVTSTALHPLQQAANKPQQQLNHINQLLSTAAAGAGIVGDVDALLTPINANNNSTATTTTPVARTSPSSPSTSSVGGGNQSGKMEQRPERNLWRTDEMLEMLNSMQFLNAIELLNDKTVKSERVFRSVEEIMNKKGFCKKSHVQIWTKWKFLKSTYTTSKRNGTKPKMISPQIYDILHNMLTNNVNISSNHSSYDQNSSSCADANLVTDPAIEGECSNSRASIQSDSSNSARMVIAEVESGYTGGNLSKTPTLPTTNNTEPEEENGLAHPIFGFRLGLVKQEPLDTGYESMVNGNNDIEETTHHIKAKATIPHSTTAHLQFRTEIKQEPNHCSDTSMKQQVPLTVPTLSTKPTRLPSLRIATFAKEPTLNGNDALDIRPPKSNNQVQSSKMPNLRIANVQTTSDFMHSKRQQTTRSTNAQNTRFGKEIMVPQRAANTSTAQLRLKHTPLRKSTPYTLRPERNIVESNRDSNMSLPEYASFGNYASINDFPNHLKFAAKASALNAMVGGAIAGSSNNNINKKKRRALNNDDWSSSTPTMFHKRKFTEEPEEDSDSESDYEGNSTSNSNVNGSKKIHLDKGFFSNIMKEFSTTIRDVQRELVTSFFNNQTVLARKEHDFQMKQDMLMIEGFKAQSEQFLDLARKYAELKANCRCNRETKNQYSQTNEAEERHSHKNKMTTKKKSSMKGDDIQIVDIDNDSEQESTVNSTYNDEERLCTKQLDINNKVPRLNVTNHLMDESY